MSIITDYKRELMTITQDLPDKEVREVLDFARFLKRGTIIRNLYRLIQLLKDPAYKRT
ncbi:MAG: DUF2281 domain-containing protein [Candidatus Brocadia sp.]|nr:DUF2281 domain-containing protein [Candidatus Brocadia sp.]